MFLSSLVRKVTFVPMTPGLNPWLITHHSQDVDLRQVSYSLRQMGKIRGGHPVIFPSKVRDRLLPWSHWLEEPVIDRREKWDLANRLKIN